MLLIVLLIVAGLCQALVGYLAFQASLTPVVRERGKARYRVAFVAFSGIGLVAVVWAGIKSSEDQEKGFRSLSDTYKVVVNKLDKLNSVPAAPAPPVQTKPAPTPPPTAPQAPVVVTRFEVGRDKANPRPDGLIVNTFLRNTGTVSADVPISTTHPYWGDAELSGKEIAAQMAPVMASALAHPPAYGADRSQMPPGSAAELYKTDGFLIDQPTVDAILDGSKQFYLFEVLTYRDASTPKGHFWSFEYCGRRLPTGVIQACGTHSGVTRYH